MRNFYSKLFFLMLPILASSQLYIGEGSSTSYVYNKGEIVFVTQDVNLQGAPDQTGGNLYLREEGQLIQGDDSSQNEGDGIASLYQVNTQNKWDYHYWTSPVGDPGKSASGNGNTGNVDFYLSDDDNGGLYKTDALNTITAYPVSFTTNFNSSITNENEFSLSSYWLYKFVATTGYGNWQKITETNPLGAGEGFTMKGLGDGTSPSGIVPIDFRGRPNNGTINVTVANNNLTLVGNPYPSAMNLSFYLLSNSLATGTSLAGCLGTYPSSYTPTAIGENITGVAYFWESDPSIKSHYIRDYEGGYGTFSPEASCNSTGTYERPVFIEYDNEGEPVLDTDGNAVETGLYGSTTERHFTPVGQGFFVNGAKSGSVTAKNEFRIFIKETENPYSQFKSNESSKKKSSSSKTIPFSQKAGEFSLNEDGVIILSKFRIKTLVNKSYTRGLTAVMLDEATLGYDIAGDGNNVSELPSDINFLVSEGNDYPFLINLFPYDIDVALPLKISGASETNTYEMQVSELNFTPDKSIYLHDKQTDEYHDILNESYEFELEKGTYTDRFEIVFKDVKTLDVEEIEEVKRSFNIYQNNGRAELTVLNPLETELKEINVFDISGRLLVSKLNEGINSKVTIPSDAWSDGIYIVRVTTRENIEYSKKVSVKNQK
ncbi:T9SS type A sorting domain-containing protein [Leeuwenhoekiella marinoflava]|nr:T9SS type A sorting domain-containing protein [Leeuwenhoekiella marinoflava]